MSDCLSSLKRNGSPPPSSRSKTTRPRHDHTIHLTRQTTLTPEEIPTFNTLPKHLVITMYHLLILLVATFAPLSHAVALPAKPVSPITSLNANTNNFNPGDLKTFAASQNLTNAAGGSDNRLLPCLSLQCVQCAAIVFFCAGSCVFAELDLPVCIVR